MRWRPSPIPEVLVEGILVGSDTVSTATVDLVPSQSTRGLTLVFGAPPTPEPIRLRAVSFVKP